MNTKPFLLKSDLVLKSATIFSSPHSGRLYNEVFEGNANLKALELRSSEDAYVDELFSDVSLHGSLLLSAIAPRAFVDLNRSFDELDSQVIEGLNEAKQSNKVKSGLGVIPRVVARDKLINSGKITIEQASKRLNEYYFPYHKKLNSIVAETKRKFGWVLLIDCHSMPNDSVKKLKKFNYTSPDIILGDCFGNSCSPEIFMEVKDLFEKHGFKVAQNYPFSGGFITQHYGKPNLNQHALQIEINRSLYMDERAIVKNKYFDDFRKKISVISTDLIKLGYEHQRGLLAAE